MKPWMIYTAIVVICLAAGYGVATVIAKRKGGNTKGNPGTGLNPPQ